MKKYRFVLLFLGVLGYVAIPFQSHAYEVIVTSSYVPAMGIDSTVVPQVAFSTDEVAKIAASDDQYIETRGEWPVHGIYDEGTYEEFIFTPDIPSDATLVSITLTSEMSSTDILTQEKLEVLGALGYDSYPVSNSNNNIDQSHTVDIRTSITSAALAQNIRVRFLGFRNTVGAVKTRHDLMKLNVVYKKQLPYNAIPIANSTSVTTTVDTPISIPLSATDEDDTSFTYAVGIPPSNGTLGAFVGNTILYTPTGALGADTFTFTVSDGVNVSTPGTVSVVVSASSTPPPTTENSPSQNNPPPSTPPATDPVVVSPPPDPAPIITGGGGGGLSTQSFPSSHPVFGGASGIVVASYEVPEEEPLVMSDAMEEPEQIAFVEEEALVVARAPQVLPVSVPLPPLSDTSSKTHIPLSATALFAYPVFKGSTSLAIGILFGLCIVRYYGFWRKNQEEQDSFEAGS